LAVVVDRQLELGGMHGCQMGRFFGERPRQRPRPGQQHCCGASPKSACARRTKKPRWGNRGFVARTIRIGGIRRKEIVHLANATGIIRSITPLENFPCNSSTKESILPEQSAQSVFQQAWATSPMLTLTL
jgi:hypothetical protein